MQFVSEAAEKDAVVVTLDRPPVNAVNTQMYSEIRDTFHGISGRYPDAKVVLLQAAGRHFCAGNDLNDFAEMSSLSAPGASQLVREAFWAIRDCPLAVIALVHGAVLGTGLAIAASADLIIAAEDARFGLPEVSIGVMGGARHLARLVPQQLVRRMFFTSDPVTGAELARYGGVVSAVPGADLAAAGRNLAARIARHSTLAVRTGKRALNQIEFMDLKQGYEAEQGYTGDLADQPDAKEALQAARERRQPVFSRQAD